MKRTGEDVLATSMLNGLLKQIAVKDQRIAELEAAAQILVDWYGENTPGTYKPPGMTELQKLLGKEQQSYE